VSDPIPTFPAGLPVLDALKPPAQKPEVFIITGMSGAGRTQAAGVLEDLGWYVVDNLPPQMIGPLAGMMMRSGRGGVRRLAAVVDVRSGEFFQSLIEALEQLREAGTEHRIVFLDAEDAELVRRYEFVRRPHPLQGEGTILSGIAQEREVLAALRQQADDYLDTTHFSVHELTDAVSRLVDPDRQQELTVALTSFGFKHGLPVDANYVVDVRFLANPYWVDELRHLTGLDAPVRDFVMGEPMAQLFVERYVEALAGTFEGYLSQRKMFLSIAVGCTGGRHRSVAISEAIGQSLRAGGRRVRVVHRDMGRA